VAINVFSFDSEAELAAIQRLSKAAGAYDALLCRHWALGGAGAADLATSVVQACGTTSVSNFRFLYDLNLTVEEEIEIIAKEIYGADGIDLSPEAKEKICLYT